MTFVCKLLEAYDWTTSWLAMRSSNSFIQNIGKHYVTRSLLHSLACSAFRWKHLCWKKGRLWRTLRNIGRNTSSWTPNTSFILTSLDWASNGRGILLQERLYSKTTEGGIHCRRILLWSDILEFFPLRSMLFCEFFNEGCLSNFNPRIDIGRIMYI